MCRETRHTTRGGLPRRGPRRPRSWEWGEKAKDSPSTVSATSLGEFKVRKSFNGSICARLVIAGFEHFGHRCKKRDSSAAIEGITILRLHGCGNAAAQRDRVYCRALAETLQHGHLRRQHVAFVDGGDGALRFVIHALGGVGDEHARGVNHYGRGCLALARGGL